jgi:hypothetical protein
MNAALVAAAWLIATLDCALMGYRLVMGRSALLNQRSARQRAAARAALIAQPAIAAVTTTTVVLSSSGPASIQSFDAALGRFLLIAAPYTLIILATTALCALPSPEIRTAANVLIFGPFSLLRPVIATSAVLFAVLPNPHWQLVVVGTIVLIPALLLEPYLNHRITHQLLASHGWPPSGAASVPRSNHCGAAFTPVYKRLRRWDGERADAAL